LTYFPGNYTSNASLKNPPFTFNFGPNCGSPLAVQLEQASAVPNNPDPSVPPPPGHIFQSQVQSACGSGQFASAPTTLAAGLPVPVQPVLNDPNNPLGYNSVQLDLKSGSVDQFNLMLEKEFGQNVITIGYVGDIGHHLPMVLNNVNVPNPTGLTPAQIQAITTKPFPNVNGIGSYISQGSSTYHALQVSFQRRYHKGITIGSNYTWSHSIDDTPTLSFEGQEGWGNREQRP
jgi:hypothetical protein